MGFLHKLWDETLAGPTPDSGLGKLRKYNSLSASASVRLPGDDPPVPVSRAITIVRHNSARIPNLAVSVDSPSIPSSPAVSSAPATPQSPTTPDGSIKKKLIRGKSTPTALPHGEPRTPTGYDWIVLSALDR